MGHDPCQSLLQVPVQLLMVQLDQDHLGRLHLSRCTAAHHLPSRHPGCTAPAAAKTQATHSRSCCMPDHLICWKLVTAQQAAGWWQVTRTLGVARAVGPLVGLHARSKESQERAARSAIQRVAAKERMMSERETQDDHLCLQVSMVVHYRIQCSTVRSCLMQYSTVRHGAVQYGTQGHSIAAQDRCTAWP